MTGLSSSNQIFLEDISKLEKEKYEIESIIEKENEVKKSLEIRLRDEVNNKDRLYSEIEKSKNEFTELTITIENNKSKLSIPPTSCRYIRRLCRRY